MFSFLNRQNTNKQISSIDDKSESNLNNEVNSSLIDEAKKSLYDSIILKRTDIVVSILKEWLKEHSDSDNNLKYFFNTNYCENGTTNPLLVAYNLQDRDLVRTLLNFGANPGLADLKSNKCLIELINEEKSDNNEHMKQLLSDCLMQVIIQNNQTSLLQYLSAGFDLNSSDKSFILPDNNSYLHWACMYSDESIVRLLLENGADVNAVNKHGATPLHEAILRKTPIEETLRVIETLLIYKSDPINIIGTNGIFKDLSAIELAKSRVQSEPEIFKLINNFLTDFLSVQNSPVAKSNFDLITTPKNKNIIHALDSMTHQTESSPSLTSRKSLTNEHEHLNNWSSPSSTNLNETDNLTQNDLKIKLWPQPQICTILSEEDCFHLPNKNESINIYFKPPHTYTYMDMVNKLASSFSRFTFNCIHKSIQTPHISVNIDKNLYQHESAYSILVTGKKIEINAKDLVSLQYAFFSFIQLSKIYNSIPSLRIIDYSDVKHRAVLLDFSQGFYFKYDNLLSLLQMFAFYKLNQVHFYVKFSSLPPACDRKQWYHCIDNWFGLMKFCEEFNLELVPSIDISNDVAELCDVIHQIKEYIDLFKGFKFINIGPRLSSLLTCIDNKNPFSLDSNQYMMLCSYLYHNGDEETLQELEKFDKYILMEYGLKSGTDFASKSFSLYKSGQPFYFCVGSSNWNSLMGCPDGCLYNLNDAIKRYSIDQPIGVLLCNFSGSLNRNPFVFNLNSIMMLAGLTWNTKISIEQTKNSLPDILITHGLINDKDGEIAKCMLELGHLETYLTRKSVNSKNFKDLPYDEGSIFIRLLHNPDDVDLNCLDKNIFKKTLFHLRAQQTKLKTLLNNQVHYLFKEVLISSEIAYQLLKFLINLYNSGTRHHQTKAVGLNVINIGVSNLNQTIRTDLANKLLILRQEYKEMLDNIYHNESVEEYMENNFMKLIDKLLIDQDEANLAQLLHMKLNKNDSDETNRLRSFSQSSAYSSYYIQNDDNQSLLYNKK